MGTGCTRVDARVASSLGDLSEAPVEFQLSLDIRFGGVLFAVPALLMNGLLRHSAHYFSLPKGFYNLFTIFLSIAFFALCRIKSIEGLRHCPPGDLGKLLGLDRIPEVRTLREKLTYLATTGNVEDWMAHLSKDWMEQDPDLSGYLYIDGHVRVYYGRQTKLPKRYVAREKLCLRGTTDYWVNDALGQPFFSINTPVNPGLLEMLRREIVPRLESDVPNQPTSAELAKDPHLNRFSLLFDREGYSPLFFWEMQQKRIACYTYRKYSTDPWPVEEFSGYAVDMPNGELVLMDLAERGTFLGNKLWVREIRKFTMSGHQTALVTTDFSSSIEAISGAMFSRWSQENFFRYMMEHFGINKLLEYDTEKITETIKVVNPAYRKVSSTIKSIAGKLSRTRALFGGLLLKDDIDQKAITTYEHEKGELQEAILCLERELDEWKEQRKKTPRHITFDQLPKEQQFDALAHDKKQLVDTIKMIAYRAETAMTTLIKHHMPDKEEARALLRQVFTNEADILPDEENNILNVVLHSMTNPRSDRIVRLLCKELNATETVFPGTNLRLFFKLVSD